MFIPIGDSPNPPGTPWVTYALIAVNVAVYLLLLPLGGQAADPSDPAFADYLQAIAEERDLGREGIRQLAFRTSRYDLVTFERGFKPGAPALDDMFTSMFLHGGLLHLLGNMLFLWIYGDNIEHRLGRLGYLLAYLGTGFAAAAGDGLIRMGSSIPSVGASGAISGVLGLYFLFYPRNRVRVWVFLFPFFADIIELPARVVLGFYVVFQNLLPALLASGTGVSYGAHLGGFVAGAGVAFLLARVGEGRPKADMRRAPAAAGGGPETFRRALRLGAWDRAAEWYFGTPHSITRRELGPWDKVRLGDELAGNGHPKAALAAYQRALGDHPRGPGRAAAHLGAGRVLMGPLGNSTGAYQHLYMALEEDPSADEERRARELLGELAAQVRTLPRGLPR